MVRPGDFITFRYPPRTVPSTPFTDEARKVLEKIQEGGLGPVDILDYYDERSFTRDGHQ